MSMQKVNVVNPLYVAAYNGHPEVVVQLIAAGADVNAIGKNIKTALYGAVANRHLNIAEILLKRGAQKLMKK